MVRTKDNAGLKVGSKAPRKLPPNQDSDSSKNNKYSGASNPYCPRETPTWQKPITQFFASSSKPKVETVTSSTVNDNNFHMECGGSKNINGNNIRMESKGTKNMNQHMDIESGDNASMEWDLDHMKFVDTLNNEGALSRVVIREDEENKIKKVNDG